MTMTDEFSTRMKNLTADQLLKWDAMRDQFLDIMKADKRREKRRKQKRVDLDDKTKADLDRLMMSEPDAHVGIAFVMWTRRLADWASGATTELPFTSKGGVS
jgi:hypothetical protein